MTLPPNDDPGDVAPAIADLDTIVSLSKRRGFIFPSSEIYGGINAVWDYGPLGVELKNNVKRAWWRSMVQERDDIVGLDAGILMHPQVWVTSGHVGSFSDPLVECQTDHRRFRLDELPGTEGLSATDLRDPGIVERLGLRCPVDGGRDVTRFGGRGVGHEGLLLGGRPWKGRSLGRGQRSYQRRRNLWRSGTYHGRWSAMRSPTLACGRPRSSVWP